MTIVQPPQLQDELTVLLVEDSTADARFVKEMLLPKNAYSFKHVSSLSAALDYIGKHGADVILLDLSLPDAQGLETFRSIIAVAPHIPILVLTGLDDQDVSIEAVKLGAQDYILKRDINESNLIRSIRYAVERKESEKAVRQSAMQAREAESFLKLALTASATGVWSYQPDTGKVVLDAQVSEMLGMGREALETNLAFVLSRVHPDDRTKVEQSIVAALTGGTQYDIEHRIIRSDDRSVRYLAGKGKVFVNDEKGNVLLTGLVSDVTERKLREQEHYQLAAIVASSDDGMISKKLDGTILTWNQAAQRIYDYAAEEMIGDNIAKLVPENQQNELAEIIEKLKEGERVEQQETVRRRKDGTLIEVSLTVSPIRDTTGSIVAATTIVRDITKRKRVERFLACQNVLTNVLSEADSLVEAAPKFLAPVIQILGWDIGELWSLDAAAKVMKCIDLWHKPEFESNEFSLLSKHITYARDVGIPGKVWATGQPIWVSEPATLQELPRGHVAQKIGLRTMVGVPILRGERVLGAMVLSSRVQRECDPNLLALLSGMAAQISQFMERKVSERAAHEARQAEERIAKAILENAPIGIARVSSNLVVTEANRVFCKQFGVEPEKLIGSFIFQTLNGIPSESVLAVAQQAVPRTLSECAITDGPASEMNFDITIWPVKDSEDGPVGVIILSIDVTERVKLAKQRDDFVATLTHDLKNPLIGQERLLDLFLAEHLGPVSAEQNNLLSLVKTSTRDMLELIGTLLEVYRYEAGRLRLNYDQVDMRELINSCIARVASAADAKGVAISSSVPESTPVILADPAALKRVIMNLLDNAVKFTLAGGLIQVSCTEESPEFITVKVQDTGSGIAADELPSLFQRFSQSRSGRRQSAGTGLGLYLCHQIVEAHGGTINCTSEEGRGSIFVFTISRNHKGDCGARMS